MRLHFTQPGWARFFPSSFVVGLATLGPLGRLKAPGTWGSLAGVAWYAIVCVPAGWFGAWLVVLAGLFVALVVCGEAERRLARTDPPEVILDEFVSMPIILAAFPDHLRQPHGWVIVVLAFLLFRLFDITKPLGIARLQRYHGGLGVLLDDVAAAIVACAVVQVIVRFTPLLNWVARWQGAA